jgi:hypothetical protein
MDRRRIDAGHCPAFMKNLPVALCVLIIRPLMVLGFGVFRGRGYLSTTKFAAALLRRY